MSARKPLVSPSEAILEEASGWFIDFNEGEIDAGGRERFDQWLRRSPEHVRAYVEIAAAWQDSSRLIESRKKVELDSIIERARAEHNVISLGARPASPEVSSRGKRSSYGKGLLAAAAAVILIAVGLGIYVQRSTYGTVVGEQRSLTLEDGSTIELNARSRVRIRYSSDERLVELLEGQALFSVRKDASRPFVVDSDGSRVRAVGTQFDVYRKASGTTTVTVIEGRVAVAAPRAVSSAAEPRDAAQAGSARGPATTGEVLLVAGEQLTVAPRSSPRPVRVDVAVATAWTQRKLVFEETPLAEAVAEFNRYSNRRIVIDDPVLARFHIRGSFEATDPEPLLNFLRDRFAVRVIEQGEEIRISGGEK